VSATKNQYPDFSEIQVAVQNKLYEMASYQLKSFCKIPAVSVETGVSVEDVQFEHWIILILVDLPAVKIQFRVHFASAVARSLTAGILNKSIEQVNAPTCHSVISEYCNLTGVSFKNHFTNSLRECISQKAVSFYAIPEKRMSRNLVQSSPTLWKMVWPEGSLYCSSTISIDKEEFQNLFTCDQVTIAKAIRNINVADEEHIQFF